VLSLLTERQYRALDFLSQTAPLSAPLQTELEYLQGRIKAEDIFDLMRTPSQTQQDKFKRIVASQLAWTQRLDDAAFDAVENYRGRGWRELNSSLRHHRPLSDTIADDHRRLQELFRLVPPTEETLLVSRGIELAEAEDFGFTADEIVVDYDTDLITEAGYSSTGANLLRLGPEKEQIDLLLEIPKGSKVLALTAFNSWDADQEILLNAGSQLRVRHRMVHPEGGVSIFAELIDGRE